MPRTVLIEVAAPPEASSTEKGRLLEKFARRLLETQNFAVTEEVRLTGTEVDLLAVENTTGERVFVECKAHRSTISADVITKLYGNVTLKGFSAGWLISTFALGKDAKGIRDEWEQRPPEERRRLQIYEPSSLIKRLTTANIIQAPDHLVRPTGLRFSEEDYLLLTPFGEFWVLLALDPETGIRQSAIAFDAGTGARITSKDALKAIAQTDTTLGSLNWQGNEQRDQTEQSERLRSELQSIVRVPIAENWADYRPARPEDFVGRDQLQDDVFDLFESVRAKRSTTRLLAIKAPSGWGKSSCVLKIIARASNVRNRNKIFVFAVDSRAAISKRFGELALFSCIKQAIKDGFVPGIEGLTFGGGDSPFSTDGMRQLTATLSQEQKLICLIFDQFEELLYKDELEPVFDQIRALCDAVDEAQENFLIGFSWKTDGTIPPEHRAYHLWHGLSDRRLEFELTPFNHAEVSTALNKFARELGQPLAPQIRRLLQDHCQGYPWLLKKLCIHIFDLVRSGMDQSNILVRSLSIHDLFKKDIEKLIQSDLACIRQIAAESPAEFFKIVNAYGDDVVNRLLDNRLVIRSGPRLSIYWDIFRDYVLTEKVPYIPINYIPQLTFPKYIEGLLYLLEKREISYGALASELGIGKGTADNLVRDLVMIGHAEANRRSEIVKAIPEDREEAEVTLRNFFRAHIVFRRLVNEVGTEGEFSDDALRELVKRVLGSSSFSPQVLDHYAQKLLRWFLGVGLARRHAREYALTANSTFGSSLADLDIKVRRRGANLFLGEAPPEKALEALRDILARSSSREEVERQHGRNSLYSLMNLGLIDAEAKLLRTGDSPFAAAQLLHRAAAESHSLKFVYEMLNATPSRSGEEIGAALAKNLGVDWSQGSRKRCGAGLKRWAIWFGTYVEAKEPNAGIDSTRSQSLLEFDKQ